MSESIERLARTTAIATVLLLILSSAAILVLPVNAAQHNHSSVTGFFGLDEDGRPIVDRHGIMLVFDGPIEPETVSVDTFEVWLNEFARAEVVESRVDGAYVFLRLKEELASDAKPVVQIREGEEIEDLANNSTNRRKLGALQIADGIAPRLTVTLSGGSGSGTGDEGPDRLTEDAIDVRITSDEPLQGAPRVIVACKSLSWIESENEVKRDIDDLIANRSGAFSTRPHEPADTSYSCGYDTDGDGFDDQFVLTEDIAHSRPGEVWEYTWQNATSATASLRDGELTVVAYASDRSRYDIYGESVSNWAAATGGIELDTEFGAIGLLDKVTVHPADGSTVRDSRPFLIIEFQDATSVNLRSVILDGEEVAAEFQDVSTNEFLYWPQSMTQGEHEVEIAATDSAGNSLQFDFSFTSTTRGDFVIPLIAGWNAISFPADPADPAIEAVFTEPSVE